MSGLSALRSTLSGDEDPLLDDAPPPFVARFFAALRAGARVVDFFAGARRTVMDRTPSRSLASYSVAEKLAPNCWCSVDIREAGYLPARAIGCGSECAPLHDAILCLPALEGHPGVRAVLSVHSRPHELEFQARDIVAVFPVTSN